MAALLVGAASALWLGILTSISPCPLATNIAAMSYIGRQVKDTKNILLTGLFYAAGRTVTYIILSGILVAGILSIPGTANFLQKYMNKILGPVLVLAGMFLLEMITLNFSGAGETKKLQAIAKKGNFTGALILGIVFTLSICPMSAALFFGSLIPLSVKFNSYLLMPMLFGLGTAAPVILFAILLSRGTQYAAGMFNKITLIEGWARKVTGVIFILVGIYYTVTFIFEL